MLVLDLHDLNAWRRQNRSRIEGTTLAKGAQAWVQEELDFLYDLNQEWIDELKAKNPTKTRAELIKTERMSWSLKKSWTDKINERFVGTQPDGAKQKRWERDPRAVMTQRARHPRIWVHFRVKPDPTKAKKVPAEELAALIAERDEIERADAELTAAAIAEQDASAGGPQDSDNSQGDGEQASDSD
jgi:ribosome assembly protein YihI (activator of Der GTPase)